MSKQRVIQSLLLIAAGVLVLILIGSYPLSRRQARFAVFPYKTRVNILGGSQESSFLRQTEVTDLLPFSLTDSSSMPIRTAHLEQELVREIPYVRYACAYVSPATRTLNINILERTPIIRFYRDGQTYFMDDEGISIRGRVGSAAYVPVAIGMLTDSIVQSTLYPLATYLHESKEYRHFFSLIDIVSERKVHLYPRVGDYIFELHGLGTLEEDLSKIPIFYEKILPQTGTNQYRLIKLSYKDQIICQRRE